MMYRLLQPEFCHADHRGLLVQLVSGGYAQVNVLETRGGVTRGGHYHKRSAEAFYVVSGAVEASFRRGRASEAHTFRKGDFFEVPPNTAHTLHFPENCVLLALYDAPIETADGKDIFSEGSE